MESESKQAFELLREVLTLTKSEPMMNGHRPWRFEPHRGTRVSELIERIREHVLKPKKD